MTLNRRDFVKGAAATVIGAKVLHFTGALAPQAASAQATVPWSACFEVDRAHGTLAGWISDTLPDPNTNPVPGVTWQHEALTLTETSPGNYTVTGTLVDPDGVVWVIDGTATDRHITQVYTDHVIAAGETMLIDGPVEFHGRTEVMGDLVLGPGADLKLVCDEFAYIGGDDGMGTDPGLHIMGAGRLIANGTPRRRWTRLTHEALTGNTIVVDDPAGWQPGDQLSITPTVTRDYAGANWWDAYDYRTIIGIDGQNITLDAPLDHPHPGRFVNGRRYTAEVINLTTDTRIWSDHGSRGHVMFHHGTGPQQISYTKFENLGPENVTGRYALHFHRTGPASAGSIIEGCIAQGTDNRSFVPHETEDITFRECAAQSCMTMPFWWDSGPPNSGQFGDVSERITYDRCIVSDDRPVTGPSQAARNLNSAGFDASVTNDSAMLGCVVVGLRGHDGNNSAQGGIRWAEGNNFGPSGWDFTGTLIHNCRNEAMGTWQNTHTPVDVIDVDAYSCSKLFDHGAYANSYHYARCASDDMATPNNFHALSAGARPQRFQDITETGRAPTDWTIRTPTFRALNGAAVEIANYSTDGAGIHLRAKATHPNGQATPPESLDVTGLTVGGQRYLFEPDCHPNTLITDHDLGEELRPVTYTGDTTGATFDPVWNCWRLPLT